jgi:hypothetical protein
MLKQLLFTVTTCLLMALPVVTNAQETKFQKYFGASHTNETGKGVATRSDNNVMLAGESGLNQPDNDDLMLKLVSSAGNEQWTKYYGSPLDEVCTAVVTNSVDETFIGGYARPASRTDGDAVVYKVNALGDLLWSKTFDYLNQDEVAGLAVTTDGGCFVAINGNWNGYDVPNCRIVRLSNTGEVLFTSTLLPNDEIQGIGTIDSNDVVAVMTGGLYPRMMRLSGVDGQTVWTSLFTIPNITTTKIAVNQTNEAIALAIFGDQKKIQLYNGMGVIQEEISFPQATSNLRPLKLMFTTNDELHIVFNSRVVTYDQTLNLTQSVVSPFVSPFTPADAAVNNGGTLYLVGTKPLANDLRLAQFPILVIMSGTLEVQSTNEYGNGLSRSDERSTSAALAADGGYVFLNEYWSVENSRDIVITKVNAEGATVWETRFGSTVSEFGYTIAATADGGFIIGGIQVPQSPLHYLAKIDANGVLLWSKIQDIDADNFGNTNRVLPLATGGYIGTALGYINSTDAFTQLIRFTATGDTLWKKMYGLANDSHPYNLCSANDGNFYVLGTINPSLNVGDTGWVFKVDADGNMLWDDQIPGERCILFDAHERPNGNVIVAGRFDAYEATSSDSIILREYDPLGNIVATNYITYGGLHYNTYLEPSPDGNILLFASKSTFSANGERVDSLLVTKFTPDFSNVIWSRSYGEGGDLNPVFAIGTPNGGGISVGAARRGNSTDAYIYKVDDQGITSQFNLSAMSRGHLQVSPNPSDGPMNITLKSAVNGAATLRLFGPDARLIWEQNTIKNTEIWQADYNFNALAPGTYFLQVELGQVKLGTTWVKQR